MTQLPDLPASRTPCWVGASPPLSWRQRLSWLISALSGTVELELEIAGLHEKWKREDEQNRIEDETWKLEHEQRKIEDETWKLEDERRKIEDERWKKFDERLKEFDSKYAAPPDPSPSNSTTPPPTEPV